MALTRAYVDAYRRGFEYGTDQVFYWDEPFTAEDIPWPLSGEWAGHMLPSDVLLDYGAELSRLDPDTRPFVEDEILSRFEDGLMTAFVESPQYRET